MAVSRIIVSIFVSSSYIITPSIGTIYYVDPGQSSSSGFGLSWSDAYQTLDAALSHATSSLDEIWLMGGYTYIPSNPSGRDDCFETSNGNAIYGGFDGTESSTSDRDLDNNSPSIISGDIGVSGDNSDNCYHVITYEKELTLDNVIIQDGNADYNLFEYGSQTNVS